MKETSKRKWFCRKRTTVEKARNDDGEQRLLDLEKEVEKKNKLLSEMSKLASEMLKIKPSTKDTPLHVACHQNFSDDLIIDVLLKEDTNAVRKENANCQLCIHSAMKNKTDRGDAQKGVSERVFETLLSMHQESVEHFDKLSCLPIHTACANGAVNESIIQRLLKAYPESVMMHSKVSLPYDPTKTKMITIDNNGDDDDFEVSNDRIMHSSVDCSDSSIASLFQQGLNLFLSPAGLHVLPVEEEGKKGVSSGDDDGYETDFSPLHLAILNDASPNIIEYILNANPYCLNLKTSMGRTALDIAKTKVPGSDDSILVMKSYEKNVKKLLTLQAVSKSVLSIKQIDAKQLWRKAGNAVIFTNRLASSLGPTITDTTKAPDNFEPPAGFEHNCVDVTLPIGFRQLRWALLNSESTFCKEFEESKMNCTQFEISPWDKNDDKIGLVDTTPNEEDFIGAKREVNYLMPKSGVVGANMAYTSETIVEYCEYCIAIKRIARNPDVPFGKTFEAHCLDVFVSTDSNTCRMITSAEANFIGKPPFIAWKIRTAMYDGITEKTVTLGKAICDIKAQQIKSD